MMNKKLIISKFRKIKDLGYIKSNRNHNTGIGKTFEDYIGVKENNIDEPDFAGYEIKSHRELSQSYVTLFTKSPSYPKGANTYLRDKFGEFYPDNRNLKKLHTSFFANKGNSFASKYSFKLFNDKKEKKIYIEIYSLRNEKLLDNSCYYSYSDLKKVINNKLKNLFYVTAKTKKDSMGEELFHYVGADMYEKPSFEKFLSLLDRGLIMYDIRIGSYKSGINLGKTHDHGSGFRIRESDITKLYSLHEKIE